MELGRQVDTLLFRLAAFYLGIPAVVQNNLLDILDAVFMFVLQCKLLGDLLTVLHSTILSHQNATVCGILFLMCYNLPSYLHNDSNLPDYLLAVLQCANFFLSELPSARLSSCYDTVCVIYVLSTIGGIVYLSTTVSLTQSDRLPTCLKGQKREIFHL
jgi:hypothetical protein